MTVAPATGLRPGWLVGVASGGVIAVGPDVEVAVAVPEGLPVRVGLAAAIAGHGREPAAPPAVVPREEHERLVATLAELGAFAPGSPVPPGQPLAVAIAAARRGDPPEGVVWTAEEALVLPANLSVRTRTRALRAFVAGLVPDGRLDVYALLAGGQGAVHGDVPDADRLHAALGRAELAEAIAVVELAEGGRVWQVAPAELDGLGAQEPHRLGPILRSAVPEPVDPELPELQLCIAEVAVANLNVAPPARERAVQGVGSAERARLIAHAEGAERYAAAELSAVELVRARRDELPGAVDPLSLYAAAGDGPSSSSEDEARLWAPVTSRSGDRRWVPAETVYLSIADPAPAEMVLPWTSSGLAAGLDLADARRRAFRELVERDAFMWTWLQRVSRERVSPHGAPEDARRMRAVLAQRGWTTTWVNLTLDTQPVMLCCLTHDYQGLAVGAACDASPAAALRRATVEALVLALRLHAEERPRPEDVRTPRDHLLLHRDPARHADHAFLFSGDEEIELGDISDGDDELEARLDDLGYSPLTVDLSLPACRPYHVVRALAPGLVPLTFGWGREPSGLRRAREGIVTGAGLRVGGLCAHGANVDTVPHPFP